MQHWIQRSLVLSQKIDAFNTWLGKTTMWLILLTILISAGNAVVRYLFSQSSNAFLEIQWYLFATVFLLNGGYVLLKNAHVRIDFIANKLSPSTRNWIDIVGLLLVVFPLCIFMLYLSFPFFWQAFIGGETSENAGGLLRWPVYLLIPVGFLLLWLQAVSEVIKRIYFLFSGGPDALSCSDTTYWRLCTKPSHRIR
jgi:TRAP-type mannitol/chloroaromatic compound transport system permease small subunit